jgi:hypothetical protein
MKQHNPCPFEAVHRRYGCDFALADSKSVVPSTKPVCRDVNNFIQAARLDASNGERLHQSPWCYGTYVVANAFLTSRAKMPTVKVGDKQGVVR